MHHIRRSGILLHPTSLPGPDGIGTLGRNALDFVDFLHGSGQTLWQILPLGPPGCGNSPYSCFSAFAGNPLLIDLEEIVAQGELEAAELTIHSDADRTDFNSVSEYKLPLLRTAAQRFFSSVDNPGCRSSGTTATAPSGFTTMPCSWRSSPATRGKAGTDGRKRSPGATLKPAKPTLRNSERI